MTSLDLRSLVVMSGILALLLAIMNLFLRLSYPRTIRGLGLWAAANFLFFLSSLLFGGRGVLHDFVSIVLANLCLLAGVGLFHAGMKAFYGLQPAWGRWALLLAWLAPPLYWYALVEPNYNARVILVCLVWAMIFLSMARLTWQHGSAKFSTRFTVAMLVLHGGVLVSRFLWAWFPADEESFFTPTRLQSVYVASNAIMLLALGMGLILQAGDRFREEFEHWASHDPLTNALTRRVFLERCSEELARCRRHQRPLALLSLDLDKFKCVNDTYGHQVGDRVLVAFVHRVESLLRRHDVLARWGGEEFVLLLPETGAAEAQIVAQRILARVAEPQDEGLPGVTVSIGLTILQQDDETIDPLLTRADGALYQAKEHGRNRIVVA